MNKVTIFLWLMPIILNAQSITVKVIDELGTPVEGAEVRVIYERLQHLKGSQTKEGKTNEEGIFRCSGSAMLGLWFWAKKEGYYDYGYNPAERDYLGMNEYPDKLEKTILLRRVINPVSLYAKRTQEGSHHSNYFIKIPETSEWCGYDLAAGDWVKPHGDGEVADLMLRFKRDFIEFEERRSPLDLRRKAIQRKYERLGKEFTEDAFKFEAGLWDLSLEVAFPKKKEGLVRVTDSFIPQSILRMPHQAPEEGYEPAYGFRIKSNEYLSRPKDVGFFLRTRVLLDEDGEIESANYAKIYGDLMINVKGEVSFTYYFNPVPNDRNLEFDTSRNLFGDDVEGSRVNLP